ncbi:cell division control protein 14 [Taxawa tesnikishii (nom. ined.)]|nr:cell division control protein 14 [Dothideales sp. JES 119]
MDPPCMPFRDAGYSQADYGLTIQDVVYGVWKAKEEDMIALKDFSLEEYERYERVDMGDFNWITPSFVAFASPQHQPTYPIAPSDPLYASLPRSISAVKANRELPQPFRNVLSHFTERGVGLVVRLNSELYSPSYFTALGIKHLDMIFDDGTCPPLSLVRKFINLAHEMITVKRKGIAVHCKAGLGRTGCLIGAYLIYRYGFTANEMIAFMRFMRPGMVVGPQQHWLHLNQGTFREWWFEDTMREKIVASMVPCTPTKSATRHRLASNGQTFTPPNGRSTPRAALGEITNNDQHQPRKTSKAYGMSGSRKKFAGVQENEPFEIRPDTEIVSMQRTTLGESESEEEVALRMLSSRKASQSPISRSGKRRAVSCTTTTTTMTKWDVDDGSDVENRILDDAAGVKEEDAQLESGSGIGSLSQAKRNSPLRRSTEGKTSVRKTSGRVGSVGAAASATRSRPS